MGNGDHHDNQSNQQITVQITVRVHPSITSLMNECRKMYKLMATYMQSYQIEVIFKPILMQFEMKITELIGRVKEMHLNHGHNQTVNTNKSNNQNERKQEVPKRDMTEAFHSL